jgi:hypothetical protein
MIGNVVLVGKPAVCVILLLCFASRESLGQSSDVEKAETQPLVIQSVPNAELKKFLTNERPVRRSVFDEFLRAHDIKQGEAEGGPLSIQIRKATYEARLSPDGILEGVARIEIVNRDSQPVLLPTPDCQLSVRSQKWKDRDDPVIWGLGPDQRLLLEIPKSGELEFAWSARALGNGSQRLDFDLGLLRAASTESDAQWKIASRSQCR